MKTKMPYHEAMAMANQVVSNIEKYCERVAIAGSLRRKKDEIGDIEIVAIPKYQSVVDMFGNIYRKVSLLEPRLSDSCKFIKGKDHYRQYDMGPINLDLFITTPEQWGVIFTIRTGSAEFSHRLVTPKKYGGLCPGFLKFKDGRIWNGSQAYDTPEEKDVFDVLGLEWIDPEKRTA